MFAWATVTSTSPLQVQLDGTSTAVNALKPASYTPAVDDRVRVERAGSQVLIHLKVG